MALIQNVKKNFSLARLACKNNISTNEKNTSFKNINLALFKFWHVLKKQSYAIYAGVEVYYSIDFLFLDDLRRGEKVRLTCGINSGLKW